MHETEFTDGNNLRNIFWANSVAVVGASTNPTKLGHSILRNIIDGGFRGSIYPVNPSADSVLGYPAYPTLISIPREIDLVIFCVPAPLISGLLEQARLKKVKGAIIISGGFREVGNLALEHELLAKARECEIRLIGPNCQGINYIPNKLCASWPLLTCGGSLAVISQSGTIAATMAGWAQEEGIGVSGVVSLGNQVDLCETDFILEFGADPKTHVIAVYLEGVKSGHRFLEQVAQILKPVIILKSGRTLGGQRAAASHTKSLAGSDDVFSGICQQIGVVRAQSLEELFDFSKGFARLPIPQGNRLMIITSSGGSGILAVDIAEEMGLCTPPLAPSLFLELKAADLPSAMVVGNPLDLTGDATAQDYLQILNIAEHYDAADMYLIIFGDPILGAAGILAETLINMKKPVGLCYLGGGQIQTDEVKKFHEKKLPVYPTPERAARSLGILYTQSLRKSYQKMDRVE